MIDDRTLMTLRQEIALAIADGMKHGAAHVAEALAKPAPGAAMFEPFQNGVPLSDVVRALRVVVDHHTGIINDRVYLTRLDGYERTACAARDAWAILRRAIGAPT